MNIINMTPHEVTILNTNGSVKAMFGSEGTIRMSEKKHHVNKIMGIDVYVKSYGDAELPPMKEDTMYIVSFAVARAFPERRDFLIPDQVMRMPNGSILGCLSFAQVEDVI